VGLAGIIGVIVTGLLMYLIIRLLGKKKN